MYTMKKLVLVVCLFMCIWCATTASAAGVCPESKRRYPGDCRLFYRCVLLPVPAATKSSGVAHAHVWVPTRCTAGLVFEPVLKKCVLPDPDWDCRNDDQLIPISKYSISTESPRQPEDITEDEYLATDKMDEFNFIIPQFDPTSNTGPVDEELEIITDNTDRKVVSSTVRPSTNLYHPAMTQFPYISVTNINSQSVDQIATQMDRIASLAHSLKAVTNTEAPIKRTKPQKQNPTTFQKVVATPMTVLHSQIPSPGGVNVIINPPLTHYPSESHYEVNLLPLQLNKITGQLMHSKQSPIPLNAQHETNLNFLGTSVLKHIVEQGAQVPANQIDTERLVATLFNKYLANKSFVKKNITSDPIFSSSYASFETQQNYDPITKISHIPIPLRIKQDIATQTPPIVSLPVPCISGVRLPNTTDCKKYYMCNASNSVIHTYTCPPYTAFDKVRRMCDVTQYARCVNPRGTEYDIDENSSSINSNSNQAQLIRVQLPPEEACDTRDKLPDPTSPRRYVLCIRSHDGRWTRHQMTCPGLLIYCPTRNFCSPKSSCY